MKKFKDFQQPLASEIRKAEAAANKATGTTNCKVTGWYWDGSYSTVVDAKFATVKCEICHDYKDRADVDVILDIPMFDRRKTRATAV